MGVQVIQGSLLSVALRETERPVLHVFASHRRFGGGWERRGDSQEEALFRATELPALVPPDGSYPIDGREGRTGFLLAGAALDYAFAPAPVSGKPTGWTLRERAARLGELAAGRTLITGAWGCGVFGNDPREVAAVLAAELPRRVRRLLVVVREAEHLRVFRAAFSYP